MDPVTRRRAEHLASPPPVFLKKDVLWDKREMSVFLCCEFVCWKYSSKRNAMIENDMAIVGDTITAISLLHTTIALLKE